MAEKIELVIKIPKYYLTHPQDYSCLVECVRRGTPLPEGHGDLIDRRELKKDVYTTTEWNGDVHRIIYEASVDDAPTIIEADKESEVEK